jgi:DNA-binding GntR family transcriptional regulator
LPGSPLTTEPVQQSQARANSRHMVLAQQILDIARQSGMRPGARLPEQQLASLCNVSRTPVRAALRLLEGQGLAVRGRQQGFRLATETATPRALLTAVEDDLAGAILRDRQARRVDETVTAAGLAKRYGQSRKTVLYALKVLSEAGALSRAPGQSFVFRSLPDGPEARAESYEFRLLVEPAAILAPGFRLDIAEATALRRGHEELLAAPDEAFGAAAFQRLDLAFHRLVGDGAANRFVAESLAVHLKLRALQPGQAGATVHRLRQSLREHLAILDQLESRQYDAAADLMRVHLRLSGGPRPQATGRGVPALFGGAPMPERESTR